MQWGRPISQENFLDKQLQLLFMGLLEDWYLIINCTFNVLFYSVQDLLQGIGGFASNGACIQASFNELGTQLLGLIASLSS